MTDPAIYPTYRGLPALAGVCTMERAVASDWSLDQSVDRLKRLHYVLRRLHETFTAKITGEPIYELKTAFSYHAYLCAEQVTLIRRRVGEMREPPLGLEHVPHPALARLMDEVIAAPTTEELLVALYRVVLPEVLAGCRRLKRDAHPLADAPTVRVARLIEFELTDLVLFGETAIGCLQDESRSEQMQSWIEHLRACLAAAGGVDGSGETTGDSPAASIRSSEASQGFSVQQAQAEQQAASAPQMASRTTITSEASEAGELPPPWYSKTPYHYEYEPRRDERFQDPYNAGVNPEAFLYDERFSAQDKTLMMYYKRLREIDVPEMMASILVDLREEEPWDFHMEMSRQLWDEARHAMMGEVGFVSLGIDWTQIPINFTWSRNLNLQLDARERHGVLFFIEQGLMPRTGKRYEWEIATQSGDSLSALFQDFDWADEVLHAQIGRRWYVPRYESLKEALSYGDRCWSKVLSHWSEYRDQGLTEHRNWWPDLYRKACEIWKKTPDPQALAYSETYQDSRADLAKLN